MARDEAEAPDAIALVEEAIHLLRAAPVTWWSWYLLGSTSWAAAVVSAWAHVSWFQPSPELRAWIALGLVACFFGLKAIQAESCARLLAWREGREPERWTWRRRWRVGLAQFRLQAFGLVLVPVAALLTVPFGWVYAYYQSATVLADEPDLATRSRERATDWPGENQPGLLWVSVFSLVVWVNFATCVYVLPWLANRLLGLDNLFATRGVLLLNSTFLAIVTVLAWLALDPLVKAFYVLRVFYGRARRTGADLRFDLNASLRATRSGGLRASGMLLLAIAAGASLPSHARADTDRGSDQETLARVEHNRAFSSEELNRAIDSALRQDDFRWTLQPLPEPPGEETAVQRFFRAGFDTVESLFSRLKTWWKRFLNWIDPFEDKLPDSSRTSGWGGGVLTVLKVLLYVLLAGIVILIGWLGWQMWRRSTSPAAATVAVPLAATPVPDLADERVHAAQLPTDGWLALARERMAAGEWRLALRALYLAQLAHLAAEGWLTLNRAKTNRDYETELARRAAARTELVTAFRLRRRQFDAVWYGREIPQPDDVRAWCREFETEVPA
jgi:hypothetical protein